MRSFALLLAVSAFVSAQPQFIITEIMYNPSGTEPASEWVEILNVGPGVELIDGFFLQDEDGATGGVAATSNFVSPGEAVILCPSLVTEADFQAAWGTSIRVFPLTGWTGTGGLNGLANSPSLTNEVLNLVDSGSMVLDTVNYDDDGAIWPTVNGSQSIYLLGSALDAVSNDNGTNWLASQNTITGAYTITPVGVYGADTGSPGFVPLAAVNWQVVLNCAAPNVNLGVSGGTPFNRYLLALALVNTGVAPNGWFFGIDIGLDELTTEIQAGLPFFGSLDGTGSFLISIPVGVCPLGFTVDAVALEFTGAGAFVQASPAITVNL